MHDFKQRSFELFQIHLSDLEQQEKHEERKRDEKDMIPTSAASYNRAVAYRYYTTAQLTALTTPNQ